jgi:hypothetical protein
MWSRRDLLKSIPLAAAIRAIGKTSIPTLSDAAQLFVDFDSVDLAENVVRTFHAAEKHPDNPVLRKVKPWEIDRGTYGSVVYDDEAYYSGMVRESGRFLPKGDAPATSCVMRHRRTASVGTVETGPL